MFFFDLKHSVIICKSRLFCYVDAYVPEPGDVGAGLPRDGAGDGDGRPELTQSLEAKTTLKVRFF